MSNVLVIGDIHLPVCHPMYLPFCKAMHKKWKCNEVVFIGDIIDWHGISFHTKEPNCPAPMDEYKAAKKLLGDWRRAFPKAKVCIGNHDERPERLAKAVSIPAEFIKTYKELWSTPNWEWEYDHIIDSVYYFHGTGFGGIHPAWNAMNKMSMSVVCGHLHARSGIKWKVNPLARYFAMDTGCGIDRDAWQFVYGKHCKEKPVLSCGIIQNGKPYIEIMECGSGEKYHRSKARETLNECS